MVVVLVAFREEVVDEHADEREEEDDQGPDDLVDGGTARLEDLNCFHVRASSKIGNSILRTPGNDVQNQNNDTNDTAAGTGLPVAALDRDGRGFGEQAEGQLHEEEVGEIEHGEGSFQHRVCLWW